MAKTLGAVLLVWGAICGQALAQTAQSISLEEAIRIALERNTDLRQAQINSELGNVDVSEARMQFTPDLTLDSSAERSYGHGFSETENRIVEQSARTMSMGASSSLTLFSGFRDVANLSRARFSRKAGDLEFQRAEETLVFTVTSNFVSLAHLREQLRVQRENLAAEGFLEQQIRDYVDAGARAAADLYQQQANVAAARVAIVVAESAADVAQVDLMRTLQLDPGGVYDFPAPSMERDSADQLVLQDLLARAFTERTDLQAAEAQYQASEQNIRVAQAGYWPTVSVRAGYGSSYTDAAAVSFGDQLEQQREGAVGLDVSIPVFDRQVTRNASRRAHLQALSARVALDDVRNEVGLQVRQAYLEYRASRNRLVEAEAQRRAAERALQTAQERFKEGAATLVELSQARAGFLQAESGLATARARLYLQRTVMHYFVGDLDSPKFRQK